MIRRLTSSKKGMKYSDDLQTQLACEKLELLENIEEELGVELFTLFDALKNGYYVLNEKTSKVKRIELINELGYPTLYYSKHLKTWCIGNEFDDPDRMDWAEYVKNVHDYGKTWWGFKKK